MTYDELVELLEARQWPTFSSGEGQFRTFCPVCEGEDSNSPSFAVKQTRDGDALLFCFSGKGGCGLDAGAERDWEHVEACFEAFRSEPAPKGAGKRWRTRAGSADPKSSGAVEVARYDYGDAVKVRYEWPDGWRKDFRWRPRKPGPRLYMPPDDDSRWVFLVEGEKDVDSLREIGLQATAASEGHLSRPLARKLRGFRVAVLRDYDLHGRRARDAAMEQLKLSKIRAVAVDLPGLEEVESRGEDVTDWLEAGGSRTELQDLVLEADAGSPAGEPEEAHGAPADPESSSGGSEPIGWRYHGGRMQEKRGTKWLDTAARFNVAAHAILVDEDGQVRGFDVTFEGAGPNPLRMVVPSSFMTADKRSQLLSEIGGPDLMAQESTVVAEFLATVRASGLFPERRVLTRAEWVGDALHVPGPVEVSAGRRELAKYGDATDVPEDEARALWREVVYEAVGWPKLVVALGFPLGSLYSEKIPGQRLFTVHITGESHTGKSESASIAMAALGDSEVQVGRLYRSWDMSLKAPGNVLKQLGVMPAWFDEAANLETTPEEFTQLLFHLMEGKSRTIAGNAGENVAGAATWTACVLSTGEERLIVNSGLTGFRRRVLELYAPLARDEEAHGRMLEAATAAHGWPIRWLAADPRPAEFAELAFRLFADLSPAALGQQVELAQAGNVATCVAGFAQLARTCGAEVGYRELLDAATYVFKKLMLSGAEEGSDAGERGLVALAGAVRTSGRFPRADELEFFQGERWGTVLEEGVVGVFSLAVLKRILRESAEIYDAGPVLAKWDEMGRLTKTKGLGYQCRRSVFDPVHGKRAQTKMYVVRLGPAREREG